MKYKAEHLQLTRKLTVITLTRVFFHYDKKKNTY